jgi:hypothetical protein
MLASCGLQPPAAAHSPQPRLLLTTSGCSFVFFFCAPLQVAGNREEEEALLEAVREALGAKHVIRVCSSYDQVSGQPGTAAGRPRRHSCMHRCNMAADQVDPFTARCAPDVFGLRPAPPPSPRLLTRRPQEKVVGAARRLLDCAPAIRSAVDLSGASLAIDDCYELWDSGGWLDGWEGSGSATGAARGMRCWFEQRCAADVSYAATWPFRCLQAVYLTSCLYLPALPLAPPAPLAGFISIPHDFNLSDLRSKLPGLLGSGTEGSSSSGGGSGAEGVGREPAGAGSGRGRSKGPATSTKAFAGGRAVPAAGADAASPAWVPMRQPCFRGPRPAAALAVRARQQPVAAGRQLAGLRLLYHAPGM